MKKPRRRLLRRLLLLPVALLLAVALWGVLDANEGAAGSNSWNTRWRVDDGTELGGYLIRPAVARRYLGGPPPGTPAPATPSPDGRYPAVLLLHQWWGLDNSIVRLADALAADGYVVLAPDLLRGKRAISVPGALILMAISPQDRIAADLDAARVLLAELPDVDPERIAVAGFCFGGTQAMLAGTRWERNAATVAFYGVRPIQDPEELGYLGESAPFLAIFGADDRNIPLEQVEQFRRILTGRDAEVIVYDGVGHAFVDPSSIRVSGAGSEAWYRFRFFLQEEL